MAAHLGRQALNPRMNLAMTAEPDTLIQAVSALRQGQLDAVSLTQHLLERIARHDKHINAFAVVDAEQAVAQARHADQQHQAGQASGLLHGVPLAHKDMFYRSGQVSRCGSHIRRDWVADTTAAVLHRLDQAGAVSLGRLNMSEFAVGPIGLNLHYGATRNPWHTDHVSGGSSSGPAAVVAAGFCYGALGSDTGASVRVPAAACGIVGLKTTRGLLSTFGAMPLSSTLDVIGPLTRTVADAALLMAVIASPNESAWNTGHPAFQALAPQAPDLNGLRLGIPESYFLEDLADDVATRFDDSLQVWRALGCTLVPVRTTVFAQAAKLYGTILGAEAAVLHRPWLQTRPGDYSPQVRARLRQGLQISQADYQAALTQAQQLQTRLQADVFAKVDALLAPVLRIPVPTIEAVDVGDGPDMAHVIDAFLGLTKPINVLGLPALSLPAGHTRNGLPTGIQLIGPAWSDAQLLTLGAHYERATQYDKRRPTLAA